MQTDQRSYVLIYSKWWQILFREMLKLVRWWHEKKIRFEHKERRIWEYYNWIHTLVITAVLLYLIWLLLYMLIIPIYPSCVLKTVTYCISFLFWYLEREHIRTACITKPNLQGLKTATNCFLTNTGFGFSLLIDISTWCCIFDFCNATLL